MTNHARATEIALVRQVQIAARANGSAETGCDFVIAKIDMCAATGTVRRGSLLADLVFALTFETGDDAILLAAPDVFKLTVKRNFFRGGASGGIFLKF